MEPEEEEIKSEFKIEEKEEIKSESEEALTETPLEATESVHVLISQYRTAGPFVDLCKCEIYENLLKKEVEIVVKEATTGYYDPQTGQETGNFVTYVIEFGVKKFTKYYKYQMFYF